MNNPGTHDSIKHRPPLRFSILLACILTLSFSNHSLATDCEPDFITLTTQAQADSFVSDHGTCNTIVGGLNVKAGPFTNLNGLENITSISGFLNIQEVNIAQLSGLHNLQSITGDLSIRSTITLNSLSYLSSLTTVGSLILEDSNFINSLTGLENLSGDIQDISIFNLRVLNHLVGLPASLNRVAEFRIETNDSLKTLTGLPVITNLGGLTISDNPMLTDIVPMSVRAFSSDSRLANASANDLDRILGGPFSGPNIRVDGNPVLTSLEGFPTLPPTVAGLSISGSPLITSLDPLAGVLEVWGDFFIQENTVLSDCSALLRILDDVDDGFPGPNESDPDFPPDIMPRAFGMELNATGCNTIEEVLNADNNDGVFLDGFEDS